MLGVVSGWRWAGPHRGTREPAAAAQGVPPGPPPGWAPSDVLGGKVRGAPAQAGLWGGSGTFKSPAQGGVGRRKASRQRAPGRAGRPCSLRIWQCWGQDRQPACANSLEPREELRAAFWFVLAVGVQS